MVSIIRVKEQLILNLCSEISAKQIRRNLYHISSQEAGEVRFFSDMSGKLAEIRQVANVKSVFSQSFSLSGVTAE